MSGESLFWKDRLHKGADGLAQDAAKESLRQGREAELRTGSPLQWKPQGPQCVVAELGR